MKQFKDIYMYLLGALIVAGFFMILYIIFKAQMPEGNKDVGLLVIGALVAKFSDVVGYFFGSSKGSSDKNELIKSQNQPNENI